MPPVVPLTYYLIAIGGTAMAPFAGLLKEIGHRVIGSDLALYPPMSERIAALGIDVFRGWNASNLPGSVDRVVVGNLAGRDNPELQEALRRGLPILSMPEAFRAECLAGRHPLVVAGTHGKTTTSALTAWLLTVAGLEPGFLVGGEPLGFEGPAALGRGAPFVVEGDEYSTSYADKGPKFLHYAPRTLLVTSVEFDHADLYADLDAVKSAFRKVVALVPADGRIVASGDDLNVLDVLDGARARTVIYRVLDGDARDAGPEADLAAVDVARGPSGSTFTIHEGGRAIGAVSLPLAGRHNVANALAAFGAARGLGVPFEPLAAGLATFRGVRRRMEERGTAAGVTVVDDFAHHPTAVATTLEGARRRYAGRRLWAAFEPRSITASRADFAPAYRAALAGADGVALVRAYHAERLSRDGGPGALDAEALASDLRAAGHEAVTAADADALVAALAPRLRAGDVVLAMSSGAFGGFCEKLLAALAAS